MQNEQACVWTQAPKKLSETKRDKEDESAENWTKCYKVFLKEKDSDKESEIYGENFS